MSNKSDNQPPLVSILIPCYNAQRWLRQCIDSALAQTYPNTEVWVLDDGSTDQSLEILKGYGDRIRFETGPNRGGNAARNRLLELARGAWLQYLDADDYLLPAKIAKQLDHLQVHPETDVVYSPAIIRHEDSGNEFPGPVQHRSDPIVNYLGWRFTTHGLLLRSTIVTAVGGWNPSQTCCQENELLLRLIIFGARFGLVDEPQLVYRFHGEQTVSKKSPQAVIHQRMLLTDQLLEYLLKKGQMNSERKEAVNLARFESARSLYRWNPDEARVLMSRVQGKVPPTTAAPRVYRLALKCFGFDGAEAVARWTRRFRVAPNGRSRLNLTPKQASNSKSESVA